MDRKHAGQSRRESEPGLKSRPKEGLSEARIARRVPLDDNIGFQLRITSETMRGAMQQRFLPHGIRLAQWQYLRVLWHDDGLSQKELSRRVRRVGANAVSVLNDLEAQGYLRRVRNPADRRNVNVFLTDKGRALKDLLIPQAAAIHGQALRGFSAEEVALLGQFLRRMRANFGES
jgi:DNA-binding MarR family transcriptional regulator